MKTIFFVNKWETLWKPTSVLMHMALSSNISPLVPVLFHMLKTFILLFLIYFFNLNFISYSIFGHIFPFQYFLY